MEDLSDYRKSYQKSELLETQIPEDPLNLFQRWFHEVKEFGGLEEVNAMTIATLGADGFPKSRVVLLKKFTYEGFIFYTNFLSEKGKAIAGHPKVCLSFFWHNLERQVIIKGEAVQISEAESDAYFSSRPEGSQLGAVVSPQSEVIASRDVLEQSLEKLTAEFDQKPIPRPKHWGGYLVKPVSVEFWQGRPNRLHDRIRYTIINEIDWKIERLAP